MKRGILIAIILLPFTAIAQITITNSDMPSTGDTIRWSNTIDQWGIDPTETGTNHTWDYSFLTETSQELDTCFSVSSTPLPYQFFFNNPILYPAHKANFAMRGQDFDLFGIFTMTSVYNYFKVDNGQYSNVGFGANINGIPASIRSTPVDSIYKFPLNYADVYSSHGEWEMSVPNTFTYGQSTERNVEVEGWGTVITPLGSFQALKVRMDIDITDTMAIDSLGINFSFPRPTSTEYHWLAPGMRFPVLQFTTSFGIITGIQYQDSLRINLSVNDTESFSPVIYPNPSHDILVIDMQQHQAEAIRVFDLSGKLLMDESVYGTGIKTIFTGHLPQGMYVLEVLSSGQMLHSKFSVVH